MGEGGGGPCYVLLLNLCLCFTFTSHCVDNMIDDVAFLYRVPLQKRVKYASPIIVYYNYYFYNCYYHYSCLMVSNSKGQNLR